MRINFNNPIPRAMIISGPQASGKTTLLRQLLSLTPKGNVFQWQNDPYLENWKWHILLNGNPIKMIAIEDVEMLESAKALQKGIAIAFVERNKPIPFLIITTKREINADMRKELEEAFWIHELADRINNVNRVVQ